jgi:hypothetical protein
MMDDPDAAYRVERSKCAFVQFKSKDQADLAITLSGTVLGGLPIKVGAAKNPIVPVQSVTPIVHSQSAVVCARTRVYMQAYARDMRALILSFIGASLLFPTMTTAPRGAGAAQQYRAERAADCAGEDHGEAQGQEGA